METEKQHLHLDDMENWSREALENFIWEHIPFYKHAPLYGHTREQLVEVIRRNTKLPRQGREQGQEQEQTK